MADYSYRILVLLADKVGTVKVAWRKNNTVANRISINISAGNSIYNTII